MRDQQMKKTKPRYRSELIAGGQALLLQERVSFWFLGYWKTIDSVSDGNPPPSWWFTLEVENL